MGPGRPRVSRRKEGRTREGSPASSLSTQLPGVLTDESGRGRSNLRTERSPCRGRPSTQHVAMKCTAGVGKERCWRHAVVAAHVSRVISHAGACRSPIPARHQPGHAAKRRCLRPLVPWPPSWTWTCCRTWGSIDPAVGRSHHTRSKCRPAVVPASQATRATTRGLELSLAAQRGGGISCRRFVAAHKC